jgi:hypothetical protein
LVTAISGCTKTRSSSAAPPTTRPPAANCAPTPKQVSTLLGAVSPPPRQSRDARRRRPSVADADELGVALCHELGCDPGADSAVTKVLAARLTRDGQQALRRCRPHCPNGHQPKPAELFPHGRKGAELAATCRGRQEAPRFVQTSSAVEPGGVAAHPGGAEAASAGRAVDRRLLDCTRRSDLAVVSRVDALRPHQSRARRGPFDDAASALGGTSSARPARLQQHC